jgi:hypothetical protein
MADDNATNHHTDASAMLDLFASVGATHVEVTWTDAEGNKRRFRRHVAIAELKRNVPALLDQATRQQHNLIVRPHGKGVHFIQLDDLKADKLPALAPAVFLALETSPGNFQAWVAMREAEDKDFSRRLRKGTGADTTASGATRIAGSLNFKPKYAPSFSRVRLHAAVPGLLAAVDQLERLGLVAAPESVALPLRIASARRTAGINRKWPSYQRCLEGAPLNSEETGPDVSRADFVFCMTAITWGWSMADTAERLMEESLKAQANGKAYAELTTRNAALAVERRRHRPKQQRNFG